MMDRESRRLAHPGKLPLRQDLPGAGRVGRTHLHQEAGLAPLLAAQGGAEPAFLQRHEHLIGLALLQPVRDLGSAAFSNRASGFASGCAASAAARWGRTGPGGGGRASE